MGSLKASASLLALAPILLMSRPALAGAALPTGGHYVAGAGAIQDSANATTITQSSQRGIIDWQGFSIGAGQKVQFNNGSGATLNRVTGGNLSKIDGSLSATGSVYLINPQGVVVGPGGKVVTNGSFIASSRDIANNAFMNGGAMTASGASNGDVVNAGTITSKTGDAILVGRTVTNKGSIEAPNGQADLVAGNQILLQPVGGDARIAVSGGKGDVTNAGTIKAAQTKLAAAGGNVYALVENGAGGISATGTKTVNGHVWLTSGSGDAQISGKVTAKNADGTGGQVTVKAKNIALKSADISVSGFSGGGRIEVGDAAAAGVAADATTRLDASATGNGNGGNIKVDSQNTAFHGHASARGGAQGGDGGTIETSGDVLDVSGARVDTTAPKGETGDWLLDPYNVTISSGTTANGSLDGGSPTNTFSASRDDSIISAADLEAALATSNVTVTTGSSAGSQAGDITVASPVTWSNGSKLTLSAYRNIVFNSSVTASGSGALALEYGQGAVASGNTATYEVNAPINLTSAGGFSTKLGSDGGVVDYTVITSLGAEGSSTGADLQGMQGTPYSSANLSRNYVLGADIDASATSGWNSGSGFDPVGNSGANYDFDGIFDGLGHTITNLTIDRANEYDVGLFGVISPTGVVRNVGLTGGNVHGYDDTGFLAGLSSGTISNAYATGDVTGHSSVGGLVGQNGGTISNAHATGAVEGVGSNSNDVGGLVGDNYKGTIVDAYATGEVKGFDQVGGLVGNNAGPSSLAPASIVDSYATGNVTGNSYVGGLAGGNAGSASITGSYATGDTAGYVTAGGVTGGNSGTGTVTDTFATGSVTTDIGAAGGLVGYNTNNATITDSYATGAVTAGNNSNIGGLVGTNYSHGAISASFYDAETTQGTNTNPLGAIGGGKKSATNISATGLTTAEMTDPFTFIDAGWDSSAVWGKSTTDTNSGYMMLRPLSTGLYDDYVTLSGDTSMTYGGANPALTGVTVTGTGAGDVALAWGSAITPSTNAGTYAYSGANVLDVSSVSGSSVYVDSGSSALTIDPAHITVTALGGTSTYGDSPSDPGLSAAGLQNGQDVSVLTGLSNSFGITGTTSAGDHTLSVSGTLTNDNYLVETTKTGTWTVDPRPITVTALGGSSTYGDNPNDPGLSATGLQNGQDVSVLTGLSNSFGITGSTPAGDHTLSMSGTLTNDNYVVDTTTTGTWTVDLRPITITADDQSRGFGAVNPTLTYTVGGDGLVNGDDLSGALATTATAASPTGDYAITQGTLAASSNYDLTAFTPGTLTVGLSPLSITANSIATGDLSDLDFTASYSGFVNGDTPAIVSGLAFGLSPVATSPLTFSIDPFGATAPNYAITFHSGLLTLTRSSSIFPPGPFGNGSHSSLEVTGNFGACAFASVCTGVLVGTGAIYLFPTALPGTIGPYAPITIEGFSSIGNSGAGP